MIMVKSVVYIEYKLTLVICSEKAHKFLLTTRTKIVYTINVVENVQKVLWQLQNFKGLVDIEGVKKWNECVTVE